jgi:hypothetical protein
MPVPLEKHGAFIHRTAQRWCAEAACHLRYLNISVNLFFGDGLLYANLETKSFHSPSAEPIPDHLQASVGKLLRE